MIEALSKFEPHRTMYLRGFDRRGAAASLTAASATGLTCSGIWSDLADFAVLVLFDADDTFGHLQTTKYLPDFDLTNVVLEWDWAATDTAFYPGSQKFQSVPWGKLSWILEDGTSGTSDLAISATVGEVAASRTYTVNGAPVAFDRVQLIYLGNIVFDYIVAGGETLSDIALALTNQINAATSPTVPLTATHLGATFTVTCTQPGQDGNTIELLALHKTVTTFITPAGPSKLTGGIDPTGFHVTIDFSLLVLDSMRQCWLTFAPSLPIDSAAGPNGTLVPFTAKEFQYVFTNWTVTDPSAVCPLKVAGPKSLIVGSMSTWATASAGWVKTTPDTFPGFFYRGFAKVSATAGDTMTIKYSAQAVHDLYLGTSLRSDGGIFHVSLDAGAIADIDTFLAVGTPLQTRRVVATGVAAGDHVLVLTVAASGSNCFFDYLHVLEPDDVQDPTVTTTAVGVAFDFDTDQTYKLPPQRSLFIMERLGLRGDIDFFGGVFFALSRQRYGGSVHNATVSLGGVYGTGTGFGDGDAVFLDIGGTTFGAAAFPADTLTTLAQRLVDGVNGLFVGVFAETTATPGQLTVTCLSPINGFTISAFTNFGAAGTVAVTGDITAGNEGTWNVDFAAAQVLNRAFRDYLADLCAECVAAGLTTTVAWSQELLGPPDVDTAVGAIVQRFPDGSPVLTATSFGSWGAGFVDVVAAGPPIVITSYLHGYYTNYLCHVAGGGGSGVWAITVIDANNFELTTLVSGGYTPSVGDSMFVELQTAQCNFNPTTITTYLTAVYIATAQIMDAAGLVAWLQFGEVGWWFFSRYMSEPIGFASFTSPISIGTPAAHHLLTGQSAIVAGVKGNTAANGTWASITFVDATHLRLDGSNGNGNYTVGGTISGGGMAYYDAYTAAAAALALGRPLAAFWTQDDDPAANPADVVFLADQIVTHVNTIIAAVLAVVATAKFEPLWPNDVDNQVCYYSDDLPFPQGGRLNYAVNLPAAWKVKAGSNFDRFKIEALSWGAFYRQLRLAKQTISFPYAVLGWARADVITLLPWFNGGCPWENEFLLNTASGTPLVVLWAFDHIAFGWPVPMPLPISTSMVL